MIDDLFERLRTVDPATDGRIAREARALGNAPGRIVEGEPSTVRRFSTASRRTATLVAVAAVVVVAIALPLTLLRSLGDGAGSTPGDEPGDWLTVGTLADITSAGVTFVPSPGAETAGLFVIARDDQAPYALSAVPMEDPREVTGERVLYCSAIRGFVGSEGDIYSQEGQISGGPVDHGLSPLALRVEGGLVQVDPSDLSPGDETRGESFLTRAPCETADGIPLEGRPGFAIPLGTQLPPIAVSMPQSGMRITSPITIAGSADVFEATVNIRVLDGNGEVLAESFAMATCGTGCRGDFSTQIDVPIDAEQHGTIQVFEYSAKDGSMINTVEIPVTLVPAEASASSATDAAH